MSISTKNFKKSNIVNPNFNTKCRIHKGSYAASRLSIPFGQTCYILTDGVLNAIKVKYIFAVTKGGQCASGLWCAAESAKDNGAVRCYYISNMGVTNNEYNQPTYLFSSVEAYKNKGNNDRYGDVYYEATLLAPYVNRYVTPMYSNEFDTYPRTYYVINEDGNVECKDFFSQVWADKDGLHFYPEEYVRYAEEDNVYLTKESACRALHSRIEVVEFTPQSTPKKEENYEISITVSIKATSNANAKKRLTDAITAAGLAEVTIKTDN